jgi:hypothetical protein
MRLCSRFLLAGLLLNAGALSALAQSASPSAAGAPTTAEGRPKKPLDAAKPKAAATGQAKRERATESRPAKPREELLPMPKPLIERLDSSGGDMDVRPQMGSRGMGIGGRF